MNTTFNYLFFLIIILISSCESDVDENIDDKNQNSIIAIKPESHDIDINGDKIMDFRVDYKMAEKNAYTSPGKSWIGYLEPLNENEILYNADVFNFLLQKEDTISSSSPDGMAWVRNQVDLISYDRMDSTWAVAATKLTTEYYFGVKLKNSAKNYIGWLKLDLSTNTGIISFNDAFLLEDDFIIIGSKNRIKPKDFFIIDPSTTEDTISKLLNTTIYIDNFSGRDPYREIYLDVNNDLINDIGFSLSHISSPGGINTWYSSVKTLNENTEIDTKKVVETFASWTVNLTVNNNPLTLYYKENFNATKEYPSDVKIENSDYYYPVKHSIGDSLQESNNWMTGNFTLESSNVTSGIMNNNMHWGIWRQQFNKFIGIRMKKDTSYFYGWIELDVNNFHITLHQSVIERN